MQCLICKDTFLTDRSLAVHLRTKHNASFIEYLQKYENFIIPKCKCGKPSKHRKGREFAKYCGNKNCIIPFQKHTEETKERLRKKRFEYLKKRSGKTAWEKRNRGELTELEQWFFDNVIIKYKLSKKYDIINEYSEYPYFIDFAFVNVKLAVELDGPAHFRHGNIRLEHDFKKDEYLLKKGWKVFRIAYNEKNEAKIQEFLDLLKNIKKYKYTKKKLENHIYKYKPKIQKQHLTKKEYSKIQKEKYKIWRIEQIEKIINSGIDFSKFGWIIKVSRLLKISHTQVHRWMKKYMSDFLIKNCYGRVSCSSSCM